MNGSHHFQREQVIPRDIGEVFAFFSDAANLGEITPPWLGFQILTPGKIHMAAGTEIRYRLGWHGLGLNWTTEILTWDPPYGFEDVQLRGPYQLWHHTHRFSEVEGGTLMTDTVRYRLPLGWIGRAANYLRVRHDVEKIFDYRSQRIGERFGRTGLGRS